jgi:hypothetical protein
MNITLRSVSIALALTAGAVSAQAGTLLTLPFQGTQSNSVQAFSPTILKAFSAVDVSVAAAGNATGNADLSAFTLPVTKVVIGTKLNITSGSAVGSALVISRLDYDFEPAAEYSVTLANFTIDYENKKVLADTTPKGGKTIAQMPLYTFNPVTPLALKFKFPLTVTGHEVLDTLKLTPEAKAVFLSDLHIPDMFAAALELDFGTLTQDISTKARKPAVSAKPYVAK